MANVDTSIYGQIRPFKMEDPYEGAAKVMQLRQAQRQFTLDDDLAAVGAETGGDPKRMAQALLERGHYEPAIKLQGQAAAQDKDRAATKKAQTEEQLKIFEAVGSDAMTLDSVYRQALQEAGGNQQLALQRVAPTWSQIRSKWTRLGHQLPEQFNPDENFASIGQAKEAVQYLKSLQPEYGASTPALNAQGKPDLYQPPKGAGQGRFLGVTPSASPAQPTELARLQAERDALFKANPQDPNLAQYDRVIAGYKAGRGTDVQITNQPPGPMTPGKAGANDVDKELLDTTKGLMRLDTIAGQFKPEYQTILTRGNQWWNSAKEKMGADLKVKEKKDLEEFSAYKRNAINSLNEYIKMITGAAMSEPEAQRILRGMPNPGQGVFDGDSPSEFKAKLDDAMKQTKMAVARLAYIKRKGMSLEDGLGKGLTLDGMPALINERGVELEKKLKEEQPGADQKALKRAVRRQLGIEFGLSSD